MWLYMCIVKVHIDLLVIEAVLAIILLCIQDFNIFSDLAHVDLLGKDSCLYLYRRLILAANTQLLGCICIVKVDIDLLVLYIPFFYISLVVHLN